MGDRIKTLTAALPLIAAASIAMVYIRAWAIFRPFDPDWVSALSASDIFAMGWSMTPTLLIAGAVGVIMGIATSNLKQRNPGDSKPSRRWKIILFATSALLIVLSYGLMMMPLGTHLKGRILNLYPLLVMWLTLLHSHAAFRVTRSLSSFTRIAGLGAVAAMMAFWDWEGAAKMDRPTLKRITFENGRELCSSLVFSGQNTLFLWDPTADKAIALERRLLRSVTKEPDCKIPPNVR